MVTADRENVLHQRQIESIILATIRQNDTDNREKDL